MRLLLICVCLGCACQPAKATSCAMYASYADMMRAVAPGADEIFVGTVVSTGAVPSRVRVFGNERTALKIRVVRLFKGRKQKTKYVTAWGAGAIGSKSLVLFYPHNTVSGLQMEVCQAPVGYYAPDFTGVLGPGVPASDDWPDAPSPETVHFGRWTIGFLLVAAAIFAALRLRKTKNAR